MVGTWVEHNNKLFEVLSETPEYYICKEILYNVPTVKLKYGDTVAIDKEELSGTNI